MLAGLATMPLLDDLLDSIGRPTVSIHTPGWPTVAGMAGQLFDSFDTSGDDVITVAEVVGVLDPSGRHGADLTPGVERLFGLIDANDDGRLTQMEVAATFARLDTNGDGSLSPFDLGPQLALNGMAPLLAVLLNGLPLPPSLPVPPAFPRAPTLDEVVGALVARFDADGDGGTTLPELQSLLGPASGHGRLGDALAALVSSVDADGDSAMQVAEIAAAVASLDADANGILDPHDHLPGPPADDGVDLIGVLLPRLRDFDATALTEG